MNWLANTPFLVEERGFLLRIGAAVWIGHMFGTKV